MKTSSYTDVGAACACNPTEEMICALIFGKNLNVHQGDFVDPMGFVEDKEAC
jgi:hypothetical protein